MKLWVSNADVLKQYVQAKLFVEAGNPAVAEDCINVLREYWNQLNSGRVDVEDIGLLYKKLTAGVKLIDRAKAQQFDRNR